ncbi:histone lysine acetyltransferase CREBBP [Trichonephila clavipes]|nr:histone lysine acetyltransferase CREBBP [Trichonephila clavipes]
MIYPDDLGTKLREGENSDIQPFELYEELQPLKTNSLDFINDAKQLIKYILENNLEEIYPNVYITIRIMLTVPDFGLRVNYFDKDRHNHKMVKPDDVSGPSDQEQTNPQDHWLVIQNCIQDLVHACDCRVANCFLHSCQKLKRIVRHEKICDGCQLCTQFIALCFTHSKQCKETKCPVPHCVSTKQISYIRRLHQNPINKRRLQLIRERSNPEALRNIVKTFIRLQSLFRHCKIATSELKVQVPFKSEEYQ